MAFAAARAAGLSVARRFQVQVIASHQLCGFTRVDGARRDVQVVASCITALPPLQKALKMQPTAVNVFSKRSPNLW